jgi:hypothetical protein
MEIEYIVLYVSAVFSHFHCDLISYYKTLPRYDHVKNSFVLRTSLNVTTDNRNTYHERLQNNKTLWRYFCAISRNKIQEQKSSCGVMYLNTSQKEKRQTRKKEMTSIQKKIACMTVHKEGTDVKSSVGMNQG